MKKSYYIKTYGCQMNYADAERIDTLMQKASYQKEKTHNNAGIIIIVSCSVRAKAEQRVVSWANQLPKEKTIILTGCMVRRDFKDSDCLNTQKNLKNLHRLCPAIKHFIPIKEINNIEKIISKKTVGESEKGSTTPLTSSYLSTPQTFSDDSITAYIPIMTGCAEFCSYCIVPFARGEEISRTSNEIITDVKNAIKTGKNSYRSTGTDC